MKQFNYWDLLTDGVPKIVKVRSDRQGEKHNRLTIVSRIAYKKLNGESNYYFIVSCECGSQYRDISYNSLTSGNTKSCGCLYDEFCTFNKNTPLKKHKKHGLTKNKLYRRWRAMLARCNDPTNPSYHRYGGRGISVCEEWKDITNFYKWLFSNGYDTGLEVDRIDNDKGYSPENCRLVSKKQNMANKRGRSNSSSKYKGVSWSNRRNKWVVVIGYNNKNIYIGQFSDEKEAARAYNKKALELNGEYAYLNKIDYE
jgi:hypothetical protein